MNFFFFKHNALVWHTSNERPMVFWLGEQIVLVDNHVKWLHHDERFFSNFRPIQKIKNKIWPFVKYLKETERTRTIQQSVLSFKAAIG